MDKGGWGEDQRRLPGGGETCTRETVRKTARNAQLQELNHLTWKSLDSLMAVQTSLGQRMGFPRPKGG